MLYEKYAFFDYWKIKVKNVQSSLEARSRIDFFCWQGQHIEEEVGACLLVGNAARDLKTLPQSTTNLTNTSANFMDSPLTGDSDAG